jgi:hypothetical protein
MMTSEWEILATFVGFSLNFVPKIFALKDTSPVSLDKLTEMHVVSDTVVRF